MVAINCIFSLGFEFSFSHYKYCSWSLLHLGLGQGKLTHQIINIQINRVWRPFKTFHCLSMTTWHFFDQFYNSWFCQVLIGSGGIILSTCHGLCSCSVEFLSLFIFFKRPIFYAFIIIGLYFTACWCLLSLMHNEVSFTLCFLQCYDRNKNLRSTLVEIWLGTHANELSSHSS